MPILTQKAVVLAKVETTAGTDANPTAGSNAIMVSDPSFTVQAEEVERNFTRNDFSTYPSRYVKRRGQMTFTVEIRGGGTADLDPDWAVLLRGCGFVRSVVGSATPADRDGILYTPTSDNLDTLTIYMYFDGILHKMYGAMGSFSMTGDAGAIATAEFTFEGTFESPTQTAMPASPTLNTTIPPIVEYAGLSWNGSSAGIIAGSVSVDWANTIAQRVDVNSAEGLYATYISGRNPTAGFTPEVSGSLNDEFWSSWESSTTRAMGLTIGGPSGAATEGNSVIFTAPAVQVTGINYGDRDNIRTYDLSLALRRDQGDDELTILFS